MADVIFDGISALEMNFKGKRLDGVIPKRTIFIEFTGSSFFKVFGILLKPGQTFFFDVQNAGSKIGAIENMRRPLPFVFLKNPFFDFRDFNRRFYNVGYGISGNKYCP